MKISKPIIIAGIFLLLVTLPLLWIALKNSTEIRSRAGQGSCTGECFTAQCSQKNRTTASGQCTGGQYCCGDVISGGGSTTTTPPGGNDGGSGVDCNSCYNNSTQTAIDDCLARKHCVNTTPPSGCPLSTRPTCGGNRPYPACVNNAWTCIDAGGPGHTTPAPECTGTSTGCSGAKLCVAGKCVDAPGNGKPAPCTTTQCTNIVREPGGKECINKFECVYTNVECHDTAAWCFLRVEKDCSKSCGGDTPKVTPPLFQCTALKIYKDGALLTQTQLEDLKPGDNITLAVVKSTPATKARFRINSTSASAWHESTTVNAQGEFTYDYTLDDATTNKIQAQLFNGTIWQ